MNDIYIYLPLPPSTRKYYIKGRILSKLARTYRLRVAESINEQRMDLGIDYPVAVIAVLYFGDNRRQDLDNRNKGLLDALTHAGVWEDDSLVNSLSLFRGVIDAPSGSCIVRITEAGPLIPLGADFDKLGI